MKNKFTDNKKNIMDLQELLNSKVSDVVAPYLADEIMRLKEVQKRLHEYKETKDEVYIDIILKASNHLSEATYCFLLLMREEFTCISP